MLDIDSARDPQGELFDVLTRIVEVLNNNRYDLVNISIGPDLPIEDDDVHVWTAVLDDVFSGGGALPFIAVGNGGDLDWKSGNARIQSPADCVNGLAVGACDGVTGDWRRSNFSSIGPGRMPGRLKPECVAFGGCDRSPYWVVGSNGGLSYPTMGTSFAAPTALRLGAQVPASLGSVITPLAVKALLLHHCESNGGHPMEIGLGRIPSSVDDIITYGEGIVRVLYQGSLPPGQLLRARIPLPQGGIRGLVEIKATLCFATKTDPQDPGSYTRSGVEVVFRPDSRAKRTRKQRYANSAPFFKPPGSYLTEAQLRADAHKWEPVLQTRRRMQGRRLYEPAMDIHHIAREGGRNAVRSDPIPYALVVSVSADRRDLYDAVVQRYQGLLTILRPVITIPVRVRP